METEEKKIREFINSFFDKKFSPSQCADFTAYFIRRMCRGIISKKKDVSDSSCNSLFWNKDVRMVIRIEADKRVDMILDQNFNQFPYTLRKILTHTIFNFHSHTRNNYFISCYLKEMMLDTYEKLEPKGNNGLYFRVRDVLCYIIEDVYTEMINCENSISETPKLQPKIRNL